MSSNTSQCLTDSLSERTLRYEARQVKSFLSCIVAPNSQQHEHVCVSGSAPLLWFLLSQPEHSISPEHLFRPNDIDIFVYGDPAETHETFYDFFITLTNNIETAGYTITSRSQCFNWYVLPHQPVRIINITVKGLKSNLSFIQCPEDNTPQEIVDRFDMDIVQVIYDIERQSIVIADDIRRNILKRQATVKDFVFDHHFPFDRDHKMYAATSSRMFKYIKRGFTFRSGLPPLRCSLMQLSTRSSAHQPRQLRRLRMKQKIEQAVNILSDVLPNTYLSNHNIGICGENMLQYLLDMNYYGIPEHIQLRRTARTSMISVYVCGALAPTQQSFFAFIRNVRVMLWNNGYNHVFIGKQSTSRRLPNMQHMTRYSIRIVNERWFYEFLWSPGTETIQQSAEKELMGIHQIWLNYNTMKPVMTSSVKKQLRAGSCHIEHIQLHRLPPYPQEYNAINYRLHILHEYYKCGWNFANELTMLPPSL